MARKTHLCKEEALKSLLLLLQVTLYDLGVRCGTSTTRDLKTITRRVEHEGISFLTISLSTFGSDFQKSLDQGYVGHDQFLGFSRTGSLPRLLGGFFDLVFDRASARLLDDPSIDAIIAIRQITLMFAKISLPCTSAREKAAISKYIECEKEVRHHDELLTTELSRLSSFARIGRLLWADMLSTVDGKIHREALIPKHGPGATADKLAGNGKFVQQLWTRRLERVFPHWEHLISSPTYLDRLDRVTILEPGDEIPAKVILVPKTLKSPRIIAKEPAAMQYMQQAVLREVVTGFRRDDFARNFVLSDSQDFNRDLARVGSIDGSLATLDLSEASDRVSNQHVRILLENHPHLFEAVDSTRSRKADVPGHGVVRLAKFASMGSALCFPMEALVFCTIVFVGIQKSLNRRLSKEDLKSFFGRVRVYGDDIIVPVEHVQSVVEELEAFGLRVNSQKSFWTGKFRESCGKDYYHGHDVSIVRVRSLLPERKQHASELASTISLRNQLFHAGYVRAVEHLDEGISKLIPFPIVEDTSPLAGRHSHSPSQAERYDRDLHRPLVKGVVFSSQHPKSNLDDYGALLKWHLSERIGVEPKFKDRFHLERAGRPGSVRIKTRWASPH